MNLMTVSFWDVRVHALTHVGVFIVLAIKLKSPHTGLALPLGYNPTPIPFNV